MRCGKCGQKLAEAQAGSSGNRSGASPIAPLLIGDDWELEADLRSVERLVGSLKASGVPSPSTSRASAARGESELAASRHVHEPHAATGDWHAAASERPKSHLLAWSILSLGLATFACGAVLLGWSFAGGRDDLWPLGLPLALIGQAGLILGLVLQLDGLWQSNRHTADTLQQLDGELNRVRHATTLLSTSHSSPGQSFYAHMAEGASPQLLLADLKGQLDLLAQQMASQKR